MHEIYSRSQISIFKLNIDPYIIYNLSYILVLMTFNFIKSNQSCGGEITNIDLTKDLSERQILEIRELWLEHHVLSFPNQSLNDDDLERFTLYFGS